MAIAYYEYCFPEQESRDDEKHSIDSSGKYIVEGEGESAGGESVRPPVCVTQNLLDEMRQACLNNSSLCHLRLRQPRLAIEAASRVLGDRPRPAMTMKRKALYRRAVARRLLDEYE